MKTFTKTVWNSETLRIVSVESVEYFGRLDLACGASGAEKSAFANEQKVSNLLTENFQEFAGKDSAILDNMVNTLTPIVERGPSQFGLAPAEEAAERTSAAENLSAAGAQAANAVRGALASRGGGTTYLPSGSEASILGTLAQDTAVKEALAQSAITERGYDIGRKNWEFATEGLMKAPGELEAPVTSAGGVANTGAEAESKAAQSITQANQAWMAPVAGIIGAGVKGALGIATGGASLVADAAVPGMSEAKFSPGGSGTSVGG